jgi:cytochrome c-type biogenesis protein
MTPALLFAFTAGAVATVNPCGWALLPAWFARRLNDANGRMTPMFAALRAGVLATVGFVVVFGLAGAGLALGAAWLGSVLPYVGLAVGVVLAVVAVFALLGRGWGGLPGGETCRRVSDRHGSLVFGIGYGLVSLSCTLPVFLAALGFSLTGTPVDLAVNMLAYALGMGTVLSALGIVAATTGAGVGGLSARGHLIVNKLGAVLLLAAAGYVLFYWGRVAFGDVMVENPIINAGDRISGTLRGWLAYGTGRRLLALALGVLVLIGLTGYVKTYLRRKSAIGPARNKRERT